MPANSHHLIHIITPITCTVLGLTSLLPHTVIAQTVVSSNQPAQLKPVEAGPGGEIKLERKYRTLAESNYQWHAHFLEESRYVTEGRDNLSGKSLASASSEFTMGELSIIPWLATGSGTDYTEFDLNIVYGIKLAKGLSFYTGYTNIHTRDNGLSGNDNELSFDLAYKLAEHVSLLASIYHSFDASGSFMEVATKFTRPFSNELHFSAQAVVGANSGYISDGHNGLNYIQLRSTISYQPATQIEVYAYASYSQAINRDATQYAGDAALDDLAWGGAGFSYRF